jgi:hypothetical protein
LREIEERQCRAWERFQREERQEDEAAQRKAAQEAYNEEKRQRIAELIILSCMQSITE